jgi:hypothetical protein
MFLSYPLSPLPNTPLFSIVGEPYPHTHKFIALSRLTQSETISSPSFAPIVHGGVFVSFGRVAAVFAEVRRMETWRARIIMRERRGGIRKLSQWGMESFIA